MLSNSKTISRMFASAMLVFAASTASQYGFAQASAAEQKPAPVGEQVNINEADAATLADVLQGIGQSRAQAIVEYREQNGPFDDLEELKEVKGVGDATVELNRDRILLE